MKKITDKVLEPNNTDNKKSVKKSVQCGFGALGNWSEDSRHDSAPSYLTSAYGSKGYSYNSLAQSVVYRAGDRIRVKNVVTQTIVNGKVMGSVSGKKELYIHIEGMENNLFASTDIANKTNDYIVISKL